MAKILAPGVIKDDNDQIWIITLTGQLVMPGDLDVKDVNPDEMGEWLSSHFEKAFYTSVMREAIQILARDGYIEDPGNFVKYLL